MKHIIAKRVPPGDRWSIEKDEVVHPSLTDCLNAIYMVNGATRFDIDAQAGSLRVGERQILEIARALTQNAKILVLDEPTAGVDVELRQKLWVHFKELNKLVKNTDFLKIFNNF
mgnify:CR=1 FL=1